MPAFIFIFLSKNHKNAIIGRFTSYILQFYTLTCTIFVLIGIIIISKKWTRKKEKYG